MACGLGTANWCCGEGKVCGLVVGACVASVCLPPTQACNPPGSALNLCCPPGDQCSISSQPRTCACAGPECSKRNPITARREYWCCNAGEICGTEVGNCSFLNCPTGQVSCGDSCCDTRDQNGNGRPDHVCAHRTNPDRFVCTAEGNPCPDNPPSVPGDGPVYCRTNPNGVNRCCHPEEICDGDITNPSACYPSGTFPCRGTGIPNGTSCPTGYICEPRVYNPPSHINPCLEPSTTYCGRDALSRPVICASGQTCIPGPPALCGSAP